MTKSDQQLMQQLGLTKNESLIYLHLLNNPKISAQNIIKHLNLKGFAVYKALKSLQTKKLIIKSAKSRNTLYKPVNPESFKHNIDNEFKNISEYESQIANLKKDLEEEQHNFKPSITTNFGHEAIYATQKDYINSQEKIVRAFNVNTHSIFYTHKLNSRAKQTRIKMVENKVGFKTIVRETKSEHHKTRAKSKKEWLKQARYYPDKLPHKRSVYIVDNKVFIQNYKDIYDDFSIITINEPKFAKLMKHIFDYIWKNSKKCPELK